MLVSEQKFITLYKYLPCDENSIKPISEGTLKYSSCIDFNDPFDCSPKLHTDNHTLFKEQIKGQLKKLEKKQKLPPSSRFIERNKQTYKTKNKLSEPEYFHRNVAANFGVLSLSKIPDNILMWSHYAQQHKGYILKLSSPLGPATGKFNDLNKSGFNLISLPVTYSEDRPKIKYPFDEETLADTFKKAVTIKANDWSYEQEVRVIDHRRGNGIHDYNRNELLNGVIFGARIEERWKNKIKSELESIQSQCKNKLTIQHAKLSADKFAIEII